MNKNTRGILGAAIILFTTLGSSAVLAQNRGLNLPGLTGGELRETDLDQGTVIVIFWTPWSPKCRDIEDRVNAIVDRWGKQAKIVTIGWQVGADEVKEFLADKKLRAPVFLDVSGDFSKKQGVTNLPWLWIVKDGRSPVSVKLPNDADSVIGPAIG